MVGFRFLSLLAVAGLTLYAGKARAEGAAPRCLAVAVARFASSAQDLQEKARALSAIVATRLAERARCKVLDAEEIRASLETKDSSGLATCIEAGPCLFDLSRVLGVGYVVRGHLERFGHRFVLTGTMVQGTDGEAIARMSSTVESEDELPLAAERMGEQAAAALADRESSSPSPSQPAVTLPADKGPDVFHFNLKFGQSLQSLKGFSFDTFTLRFDMEADYYLRPYLLGYLEAGLLVGRADSGENRGSFSLIPLSLGLKYVFRSEQAVRPYAGVGLGLGIIAALVEPVDRKLGLHFNGLVGLAWLPWDWAGFNLELSLNLDELAVTEGSKMLLGFHSNFGVLFVY